MTTLTDLNSPRAIAQSQTGYFYFYMALACMAVAFLGFAPTYWLPLAKRSFSASPVVHFHGLLFFAWSLYFAFQSWLAASGKVAGTAPSDDRRIAGDRDDDLRLPGGRPCDAALGRDRMTIEGIAFAIVPLSGIAFFAVVVRAGDCRHPQARTPQAADAAGRHLAARRRGRALVPDLPRASRSAWSAALPVTIPPAFVAYLLLVAAMVFRLAHARQAASGLCLPRHCTDRGQTLNWPISVTPLWHSFAGGIPGDGAVTAPSPTGISFTSREDLPDLVLD
jgi:hypothetical protein